MKHYYKEEWINYIEHLSDEAENLQIEEHLNSCDACLMQYISILEDKETAADDLIPPNFVNEVMNKIEKAKVNKRSTANNNKKMFIYYACAACITLFLMGSGAFTIMSKSITITTAQIIHSPAKIEASLGKFNFNNMNFKFMNMFKTKF